MPGSLTDLTGLRVSAEDFLTAVLATAAQPIWVVDPEDLIRFANPAAIAALGFESADELLGCRSHETIHYRHPDGTHFPAADCPMLLPRTTGETVASDLDWFFRRDGSMFAVSYVSAPIEMQDGRGAVVAFADIEDRLRADQVLREHDAVLAAELDALRRMATLAAEGAPSAEVFAAVAREVAQVLDLPLVAIFRYEADGAITVIGAAGDHPHRLQPGTRWPPDAQSMSAAVLRTGRPLRIDDLAQVPDPIAVAGAGGIGTRSAAGAPIIVDGGVWGMMAASPAGDEPLPERIEDRLANFTTLVATAISNSEAREDLRRLADEQAALRRVATLVAEAVSPSELFGAVAEEVGSLLGADFAGMIRYENDGTVTPAATWAAAGRHPPVPDSWTTEAGDPATQVFETRRPARIDDWADVPGPIAAFVRKSWGSARRSAARLSSRGACGAHWPST